MLANNLKRQRRKSRFRGLQLNLERSLFLLPIQLARSRSTTTSTIFHDTLGHGSPLLIQHAVLDPDSTSLTKDGQTRFVMSGDRHQDPQPSFCSQRNTIDGYRRINVNLLATACHDRNPLNPSRFGSRNKPANTRLVVPNHTVPDHIVDAGVQSSRAIDRRTRFRFPTDWSAFPPVFRLDVFRSWWFPCDSEHTLFGVS